MEAVDQAINYAFKGGEMTIRLAGSGAKNLILLIAALLKETNRTKGAVRLSRLLKEGKEQTVFTVGRDQLKEFHALALKYGVLYSAVNNPNSQDIDIIVKAEDIPKVKRIYEKLGWGEVEIQTEIKPEPTSPEHEPSPNDIKVEEKELSEQEIEQDLIQNEADEIKTLSGSITYYDELIKDAVSHPKWYSAEQIEEFEHCKAKAISELEDTYGLEPDGVSDRLKELQEREANLKQDKEEPSKDEQKGKNQETRKTDSRLEGDLRESVAQRGSKSNTTGERFSLKGALDEIAKRQADSKPSDKSRTHSREPKMPRGGK